MFKFLKKNKEPQSDQSQKETGLVKNLFTGLKLTRKNLATGIKSVFSGKATLDPETIEQLEAKLLTADIGVKVTQEIIAQLKAELKDSIRIIKINVDTNQRIAAKYQIQGVPTFMVFKKGEQTWRQSGMQTVAQLKQAISL